MVAIGFQNFPDILKFVTLLSVQMIIYLILWDIIKLQMIQLLSNFPLQVITLDDCYRTEMFQKKLNSLAIHPKIPPFWQNKSLRYNQNLKKCKSNNFSHLFQSYICSNSIHRYATSVKSNSGHNSISRKSGIYATKITTTTVSFVCT